MSRPDTEERLLELLADRATEGLDPAAETELEERLRRHPHVDPEEMALVAATMHLWWLDRGEPPEMPEHLRSRLAVQARDHARSRGDGA